MGGCTAVVEQLVVLRSAVRARPAPKTVALKAAKHFAHKARLGGGKTWGKIWKNLIIAGKTMRILGKAQELLGKPSCFLFSRTNFGILRLGTERNWVN